MYATSFHNNIFNLNRIFSFREDKNDKKEAKYLNPNITRMTTFIKTKFKISEDQTNIDKYRLAANITVYHIISKLILDKSLSQTFVVQ